MGTCVWSGTVKEAIGGDGSHVYTATPSRPGSRALVRPVRGEAVLGVVERSLVAVMGAGSEWVGRAARWLGCWVDATWDHPHPPRRWPLSSHRRPSRLGHGGQHPIPGRCGGCLLVRRLSHSSFSWASLGCKEQRGLAGTRGPMVPCKATPFVGSLATIFSSGCRGMTGCFPRSSHLAVHGRWGERGGEARCRSWRD